MICKIGLLEVEFLFEGATICVWGNIDCCHVSGINEIVRHHLCCNFFLCEIFSPIRVFNLAVRAVIWTGASVMRSGRGVRRLGRGFFQEGFEPSVGGRRGGQGTVIGSMVPGGVRLRGPWRETKLDSDSRPRS
jgi:hypothetical protein